MDYHSLKNLQKNELLQKMCAEDLNIYGTSLDISGFWIHNSGDQNGYKISAESLYY